MNPCLVRKWNRFLVNLPDYLFGGLVVLMVSGVIIVGALTTYTCVNNKTQLLSRGYDKAQLKKFTGIFQHIDYNDLLNDKDCQRFYKKFYEENQ